MIGGVRGIGEDREGHVECRAIACGIPHRIAQNDEHLGAGGLKLWVKPPQLSDVRTALPSLKGAHEEEHDVRPAAVIRQGDLIAGTAGQAHVRRKVADA